MAGMITKPCNKEDQLKKESLLLKDPININFFLKDFLGLLPKTEFLADSTVINSFLGTHRNNSSAYRKERNAIEGQPAFILCAKCLKYTPTLNHKLFALFFLNQNYSESKFFLLFHCKFNKQPVFHIVVSSVSICIIQSFKTGTRIQNKALLFWNWLRCTAQP